MNGSVWPTTHVEDDVASRKPIFYHVLPTNLANTSFGERIAKFQMHHVGFKRSVCLKASSEEILFPYTKIKLVQEHLS